MRKDGKNKIPCAYVDTDVIIRLLTADDLQKQQSAARLFTSVVDNKIVLLAPVTVIADAVYVLSSARLYHLPRAQIRNLLTTLIKLSGFKVDNKRLVLQALEEYAGSNLDFGDAYLIASARQRKVGTVYSFDRDFDKIDEIIRKEP